MKYTLTEKRRLRKRFGQLTNSEHKESFPDLLESQRKSYEKFLQLGVPASKRGSKGLQAVFESTFPIRSAKGLAELSFESYEINEPEFDLQECRERGLTYGSGVQAKIRLSLYDGSSKKRKIKEVREQNVYICLLPMATELGSFVINGTDRVVVNQLHRSPGVIFHHDGGKMQMSGKLWYFARIIPYRGSWLDFEFDSKDHIYARIDRRRKLPVTLLLNALGMSDEEILAEYFEMDEFNVKAMTMKLNPQRLNGMVLDFSVENNQGECILSPGQRISSRNITQLEPMAGRHIKISEQFLLGRTVAKDIVSKKTGEVLAHTNSVIDEEMLQALTEHKIGAIKTIYTNDLDRGDFISSTLRLYRRMTPIEAQTEIYRCMRPSEPPTADTSRKLFEGLFFQPDRYDLSKVGRMKLNRRLGRPSDDGKSVLDKSDIVEVIRILVELKNGNGKVDDIDNLGNRRVRSVGELVENQFRLGFARMSKPIQDRLAMAEAENLKPQDLINAKPISAVIREFFGSSQLSQFMDQTNPLAEVTHKRRISALGPGGLTRDRAGFEVRDVHPSHYGRICPIETPEGPNIGLINSLAVFARINSYGFIESPVRKVKKGVVTNQVEYLSAIEEHNYVIAQANTSVNEQGKLLDEMVSCRHQNEYISVEPAQVDYMDLSPAQVTSVAASLIPFLEHNDANRALMGSNMQRQAVPTVRPAKPLVGTGMEKQVALDSGAGVTAKRGGTVVSADATRIVVQAHSEEVEGKDPGVDIYNLVSYMRSNQNTAIKQPPVVRIGDVVEKGDILADGPAMDLGELALGQNVLAAFMPWNGYNFEDSILISERLIQEDMFTSVHIEEFSCVARETRLGSEEITNDIPSVGENALSKVDGAGIVYIGLEVSGGDILVGKVTPKADSHVTPEEKLLRAIFGSKAVDVKDSSLRMPQGMRGTVIDVQIFTREGLRKDSRAEEIDESRRQKLRQEFNDQYKVFERNSYQRIRNLMVGQLPAGRKDRQAQPLTAEQLEQLSNQEIAEMRLKDDSINRQIEEVLHRLSEQKVIFDKTYEEKNAKISRGDELPANVLKSVKVFVAVRRPLQIGDKMAGRHGNKGVVSRIVPEADMPYMADGRTVDIVLNPLGVPSRMNLGQLLEANLGLAADGLGRMVDSKLQTGANAGEMRSLLERIYNHVGVKEDLNQLSDQEIMDMAHNLREGVPMATPVFDGAKEIEIKQLLSLAGHDEDGKCVLYDGLSGSAFDHRVTVGYVYMCKLNHLVDEKMHMRSTGPYSLVTQQPLGGKAQVGGQRFGEMEVWALEAYGAAYTLQEMLTIKSDDLEGRTRVYQNIIDGSHQTVPRMPESFNVLVKEIRSLGMNMEMRNSHDH